MRGLCPSRSRDLSLCRQNAAEAAHRRPRIPASGSALWSHPCGAISSAQVPNRITEIIDGPQSFSLPPGAVVGYNNLVLSDSVGRF